MSRPVLYRILEIDQLIRQKSYPNAADLARRFEVSTRTIHRDLEHLRDLLGAPLEYDHARRGYFYTNPDYVLPSVNLSGNDWLAVLFSLQWLQSLPASPLRDQIERVLQKLPFVLPEGVADDDSLRLEEAISIGGDSLRGDEEWVSRWQHLMLQAIFERRRLRMVYFSSYRLTRTERRIDPYHLRLADGAWYVIAHCHNAGGLRTFALDRVEELEPTGERFERPQDFSVEDYLRYAWRHEVGPRVYDVVLRVDPYEVPWLATRRWHWSQRRRDYPDGIVHLHFKVSGLQEMKRWILQFGPRVEVVSPPALRDLVQREAEEIVERYGGGVVQHLEAMHTDRTSTKDQDFPEPRGVGTSLLAAAQEERDAAGSDEG